MWLELVDIICLPVWEKLQYAVQPAILSRLRCAMQVRRSNATFLGLPRYTMQTEGLGYGHRLLNYQGAAHGFMQMMKVMLSHFYAQTTPRGRGMMILFVVILLLAFATGERVLYRLSYFLALAVVGSYAWTRLNLSRLHIRVEKQSSVAQVGGALKGSIYVRNNSPVPTGWLEMLQMSNMPGYVFGEVTRLPGWGWAEWTTQGSCYARGVYTVGPLMAIASDPLGLFRVQIARGDRIAVVVYPTAVELPYFDFPAVDQSGDDGVLHRRQTRTAQASTVREYSHGDSLNRIHWPSTARHGQLMSKEFDSGSFGDVWVVLDLEQRIQKSEGMEKTDEYAVAAAASLAHLALTEERSLGLIAYGDREYLLPLASGIKQMSRVLEMLARSRTEGNASLSNVLSQNTVRFGRFACVFVVTSSTDIEWVSILQNLAYRGLGIVVVLVDPASFGGEQSCQEVVTRLVSAGIPAYVIRKGDMLSLALSRPISAHDLPIDEQSCAPELTPISQVQ